ncbi:YwqI/YxiC family protein, partial [Virgibacillus salexigens]|uniref:YwqI/YxiC family protein n=1 Tax=Virgibacillus salexigens TaxID=61016 RepID=UPI00190A536B
MSEEIKLQQTPVEYGIAELRTSIQELNTSFPREIDGENQLRMLRSFNEIKREYEELLNQFEALFVANVNATENAITKLQETEQQVANDI